MTTREEIRDVESKVNALHRRIHEIFATREKSKAHWERWEAACRDYHAYKNPTEQLGPAVDLTRHQDRHGTVA
jgi:hypothetical protein